MQPRMPHLHRRRGINYYRRRVPLNLIAAIGKPLIQFSLKTSDRKEALRLRAIHDVQWDARFSASAKACRDPEPLVHGPVSNAEIIRIVQQYVRETDARRGQSLLQDPPANETERRTMRDDADLEVCIMGNLDDPRSDEHIYAAERKLFRGDLLSPHVGELVRQALIEIAKRHAARVSGDHSGPWFNKIFDPAEVAVAPFSEVAKQHLEMVTADAKANGISGKWVEKQASNIDALVEIVGSTVPITAVDFDVCQRVRRTLAETPAHRKKLYPGLGLQGAVSAARVDGASLISPTTQTQYLDTFRNVLGLAVKKGLLPSNPAADLDPLKRDLVPASQKRKPFKLNQLKALFEQGYYTECGKLDHPYRADKHGWRFWLPFLCLFMGLRPNEACQMLASDAKHTEAGTLYLDIVETNEEEESGHKSLKTPTSRRKVPVHPELIRIGFQDFVHDRQKHGPEALLFTGLKPDKHGNHAKYALRRFRETFLPEQIQLEERQSFYSFRHNFRDALRGAQVTQEALQVLGGWSQGKKTSDAYGDATNPDFWAHEIAKVCFPGLNLDHLYVQGTGHAAGE